MTRFAAPLLAVALLLSSCASLPPSYRSAPERSDWSRSTGGALRDARTWVPALAAVAVAATGSDQRLSGSHHVFGSAQRAEDASNRLKGAVHLLMLGTALLPTRNHDSLRDRLLAAAIEEVTTIPTAAATGLIKHAAGRERPDASDQLSFPSGHASMAASYAAIASRNLEDARASRSARVTVEVLAEVLVAGTAWARVEAEKHYATDVLAGAALGSLVTRAVDGAFRDRNSGVRVAIAPSRHGVEVSVRIDTSRWLR